MNSIMSFPNLILFLFILMLINPVASLNAVLRSYTFTWKVLHKLEADDLKWKREIAREARYRAKQPMGFWDYVSLLLQIPALIMIIVGERINERFKKATEKDTKPIDRFLGLDD